MLRNQTGVNPDGTPHYNYTLTQEEHDAGYVAFFTGPIVAGSVSLPDNTVYDITEGVIPVKREHVGHLHRVIHKMHLDAGRTSEPVPDLADVALD